jgi:4-hydroxy 2-oxovalerate aldolase|tara:strand:+ start:591 stop:2189 length:1599 start_codon:yes stop_codon:yes gene_type:complete
MNKKIQILDCTLRDGGYYNNWDFDAEILERYLASMADAQIDYVELGLRQLKNESFLGAHAYTTSEFLSRINLPEGPTYGVMIDAKTILTADGSHTENIDELFLDSKNEKIDLVRIAAHHSEVLNCFPMIEHLKKKGYKVGLNIMQISACNDEKVREFGREVETWNCVDVLYFADSLGSMNTEDVSCVYNNIREYWSGDVGFHSHNNLGQGIANVLEAKKIGCSWLDVTVTGMGRGAGNAQTEYLLLELNKQGEQKNCKRVFELVTDVFEPMRHKYKWGPSLDYYLAALDGIHPTYVQNIVADSSIPPSMALNIINDISNLENPGKFEMSALETAKSNIVRDKGIIDGNSAAGLLKDKEVLLVAQNEVSLKYQDAVIDYVKKRSPTVMSINYPSLTKDIEFDNVVISHNQKVRFEKNYYSFGGYSYIAPKKLFLDEDIKISHDYGISIKAGEFEPKGSYACIPNHLTLAYAISFCLDAGASDIKLIGVSGIDMEHIHHKDMQMLINILLQKGVPITSLTPSSFAIKEKSIYAI